MKQGNPCPICLGECREAISYRGVQQMSKMIKQVFSVLLAAALHIPAGWNAPVTKAATQKKEETKTVYHETFANGAGKAVQSGSASLTAVTGKIFDGNTDGAALYVSKRVNNWDAADFSFSDLGLANGKTYTVTAIVYVDADVNLPSGANAALQTVNSYEQLWKFC